MIIISVMGWNFLIEERAMIRWSIKFGNDVLLW